MHRGKEGGGYLLLYSPPDARYENGEKVQDNTRDRKKNRLRELVGGTHWPLLQSLLDAHVYDQTPTTLLFTNTKPYYLFYEWRPTILPIYQSTDTVAGAS